MQEAYKLDVINDMADSIGKSIQTLAGVTENGFSSTGFYVGFLLLIVYIGGNTAKRNKEFVEITFTSVSYTHLDVYKRQHRNQAGNWEADILSTDFLY